MQNELKIGDENQSVVRLQQYLNIKGFHQPITGYFGSITSENLKEYQSKNEMNPTGIADESLIQKVTAPNIFDKWCHAAQNMEGFFAPGENPEFPNGSPAWINNNPGNCDWEEQNNAIQNGRFAKFDTYQDGYNYLMDLFIFACSGQSSVHDSNGTLIDFYAVYAPDSDGNNHIEYANNIATAVGFDVVNPIKNLLSLVV